MSDPQATMPPNGPWVPPWAPTLPPPPANTPPPPPPAMHGHPQHLMSSPPLPPFAPFSRGNPGFFHGFPPPQQQQHFYNLGPRTFPFRGPPPNHGSFGASPPLPLPPRAPPQMVSGTVSAIQRPNGGARQLTSGNVAYPEQYNRPPPAPLGMANRGELGFRIEKDEEIPVIEKAVLESQKRETKVDLKELLCQIRALVGQTDEAVQKVGKLVMLEPSISESRLVTCPYDPTHRVSPKYLFKHFLCCPSNPKPQVVDPEKLLSCLRYPHSQQNHDDDEEEDDSGPENAEHGTSEFGGGRNPNSSVSCRENVTEGGMQVEKGYVKEDQFSILRSGDATKSPMSNEIDIWGGRFFYKDSPAVVQAPVPTPYPASELSVTPLTLTHSADNLIAQLEGLDDANESISSTEGIGSVVNSEGMCNGDGERVPPLLSSRFWFLQREIETWRELPTRCSTLVLQAATGVGRIRRRVVSEWVLMQGPVYGVVIDSAMANHIHSLARICLRSLQKESASNLSDVQCDDLVKHSYGTDDQKGFHDGYDTKRGFPKVKEEQPTSGVVAGGDVSRSSRVSLLDCPDLFQSGHWLASQLSSLFGPLQSNALVLKLLKYCLVLSGRILASSFVTAFTKQRQATREELQSLADSMHFKSKDEKTLEDRSTTLPLEVETAIAAVRERAILESYLRNLNYPSLASKFQMIQDHEAIVMTAATERRNRVNYRPVLEHDGLIWHRFQLEEKNRNKTREEILAEERDYKRRRMSYRGKKLKRNPTEVLHDLIGGHMEEIIEAGGIGCSVKYNMGVVIPSAETGGVDSSSQPGMQDDLSNEQMKSSRAFKQDFNNRSGTVSQGIRYLEVEDASSGGKFHRQTSHHSSDSGMVKQSFHSRSGSGRDHGDESRSYWTGNSEGRSEKEYRGDRSHSQRYSGSPECSNEGDGYERLHSREYRGKSKSSY